MISIVLPVYNGEEYLRQSIDSILAQTYPNFELIIVNDCSTDSTPDIINEYLVKDKRIRVINNETNQRLPKSLNIGFNESKGDYLTWTSDDNLMKPNALNELLHAIKDSDSDLAFSRCDTIDKQGNKIGETEKIIDLDDIYYNNIVLASFLYKRCLHEELGGYDIGKFLVEDYDFWLRAYRKYKFIFVDKSLYQIRYHGENLGTRYYEEVKLRKIQLLKDNLNYVTDLNLVDKINREISLCYAQASDFYYNKINGTSIKNNLIKYLCKTTIKKMIGMKC